MFKPWQVILFLLVVVLGVAGFIFWYYSVPNMMAKPDTNTEPVAAAPVVEQAPKEPEIGPSTDEGLDADLASVDAQLKVVDTNSASVEQSLNDKPVTQTE